MKIRPLGMLAAVVVIASVGRASVDPLVAQSDRYTTGCADVNWPPLQPSDPAYRDAADLARALGNDGFIVHCIAQSKMVGTFDAQTGAALYRTDRGDFEALFLSRLQNFDGLQIFERAEGGRYLYSFGGRPRPWTTNLVDASRPVYFIKSLNRLIVAYDRELAAHLGTVLAGR